ncbi:MAG: hypothetical protein ACTSWG_10460 [Candidatus Helarchaeota archaeon]
MSVQSSDIKFYLTGAVSDGGAQSDPNASLGGYRSSTEIISAQVNNLFDNISSAEASAGDTDYRCICVKNTSLETLYNVVTWLSAENDPDGIQQFSFAIEVPQTADLTDGDAQTIGDEDSAPTVNTTGHNGTGSGISDWSTATSKGSGVSPDQGAHDDDLDQDEIMFIWIKRVISAGAPARTGLSGTIKIEGDTN